MTQVIQMQPSEMTPLIQLRTALNILGLEPEAIDDEAEIRDFLRMLMTYEIQLYLVDVNIYGVSSWFVDQSPTTLKGPGLFEIDYQEEGLNQELFHSNKDDIYIHYDGIGISEDGDLFIQSRAFNYSDDTYYCSDNSGMLVPCQLGLSNIYVLREQILGLTPLSIQNLISEEKISLDQKEKPKSIHDIRHAVFKTWLVMKANSLSADNKFTTLNLQQCYDTIGEPTWEQVWAALKTIDPDNFRSGANDFQKKHRLKEVTFKTGSRPKPKEA